MNSEENEFYIQNKKEYEVHKNKKLLKWLKSCAKSGCHTFESIEELQFIIDYVTNWYEIKYPNIELQNEHLSSSSILSKKMTYEELNYRLSTPFQWIMDCSNYRSAIPTFNEKSELQSKAIITVRDKETVFRCYNIDFNRYTGKIIDCDDGILSYTIPKNINIEILLTLLKNDKIEKIDYSDLERAILLHDLDMELRKKLIRLIALKILYSKNSYPKIGYIRAKLFLGEFNKAIPMLDMDTQFLDELFKPYFKDIKILNKTF